MLFRPGGPWVKNRLRIRTNAYHRINLTVVTMEKTFSLQEAIAHTDKTIAEAGKRLEQRAKDYVISSKRYENGTVSK